ncbi:MAG: EAL domain-containing protein [Ruthenibacterium sp.]
MTKKRFKASKTRSVRRRILLPVGILLVAELALLCTVVLGSGLLLQLNDGAKSTLRSRVSSRAGYLQTEMVSRWSNIGHTMDKVNGLYADLCAAGTVSPETLTSDAAQYSAFLTAAAPSLIEMMRTGSVTGAMLTLNTAGYAAGTLEREAALPCLYLRDRDPVSGYNADNGDILLEYAPVSTVKSLPLSCDSGWIPMMHFQKGECYPDYLTKPYHAFLQNSARQAALCGYWSLPHTMPSSTESVITYTVPLVAQDGAVYGTLGVELLLSYLRTLLPSAELSDGGTALYALYTSASPPDDAAVQTPVVLSGPAYETALSKTLLCDLLSDGSDFYSRQLPDYTTLYLCQQPLTLYDALSPFAGTQWLLAGGLPAATLFALTQKTISTLLIGMLLISLACLLGMLVLARLATRPLEQLSARLRSSSGAQPVELPRTGIAEVDSLAESVEDMSRELYRSSDKFSQIVRMASNSIGGFEYNSADGSLFINSSFFRAFGIKDADTSAMTAEQFNRQFHALDSYVVSKEHEPSSAATEYLYSIPRARTCNNKALWVRLRLVQNDTAWVGLVEDVTAEQLTMEKIAFERDHDVLTGLLNRRAWTRMVNLLFATPKQLKFSALLMFDLDNLKFVNDTYGHDAGDAYICAAADALRNFAPPEVLTCRKSGDEFLAFFYGYDTVEELRTQLMQLRDQFRGTAISLKNGRDYPLRASGGIAWYPNDTTDLGNLLRYADFAMYKVKSSVKGDFCDFEPDSYDRESYLLTGNEALNEMLLHDLVDYYFQPIVSAVTGEVFAYEALMRPQVKSLRSPENVLALARHDGRLVDVERMTWFCAMDAFVRYQRQGFVSDTCHIFINSIPNVRMSDADAAKFAERFRPYLSLIVQEQTEHEHANDACVRYKKKLMASWGAATALDDYGSGLNNEKALLTYGTDYVKLDISLIHGIDTDVQRRQMVAGLVQFARLNNLHLVAEGVETAAELVALIELGVDYLQGYYLARPALIPPILPVDRTQRIQMLQRSHGHADTT